MTIIIIGCASILSLNHAQLNAAFRQSFASLGSINLVTYMTFTTYLTQTKLAAPIIKMEDATATKI